jgi:hypothetical protein
VNAGVELVASDTALLTVTWPQGFLLSIASFALSVRLFFCVIAA